MTKGLEVAQDFFQHWGLPFLQKEYPHLVDRVASLICGGSQSLGNDDELSRDHGWGPHFDLVLTGEDMKCYGRSLERQINEAAPNEWRGYTCRHVVGTRYATSIPVASINPWFKNYVGCSHPPKADRDWFIGMSGDYLYMLRHATVFHDPLGEFSSRRQAFHYYPERAWLRWIVHVLYQVWHYGQYNFLERLTRRQDSVAIIVCIGQFTKYVMRLYMLLARDYIPYWKWLAAEFRKLSDVAQIDAWLRELSTAREIESQASLIRSINSEIHSRLSSQLDLNPDPKEHPHPLYCAKEELAERIGGEWY
ncbi:MAG: DUF4037 domain-containing protein [Gemmatimonadetes bacterium]|jgi:hypothetical protein|nr:DUF4037 domain-containing protein [Gemmatimonadota bacterium]